MNDDAGIDAWTEDVSAHFMDYGRYYVPDRDDQIALICDLIPAPPDGANVVELCCGEGLLARALLDRFPGIRIRAFDGSEAMLAATEKRAGAQSGRLETVVFDLAETAWRRFDVPAHAVVSSLAVHHLDGPGKQALFRDMGRAIAPGGVLILADLVAPVSELAMTAAAKAWDEAVRRKAEELDGNLAAFERFRDEKWNYYADPDAHPIDQPSPLFDQLTWLAAAGFEAVDVYWMKAGQAIYGGRKPGA
jgi:tRNA (cmo5U34)-methyltransferase